jgi:hypothetical protein
MKMAMTTKEDSVSRLPYISIFLKDFLPDFLQNSSSQQVLRVFQSQFQFLTVTWLEKIARVRNQRLATTCK